MKNVIILVPESSVLAAIVDPRYMFTAVNEFLRSAGQQPKFNVLLMGLSKEVKLSEGLFSVHTDVTVDEAPRADLILIPALSGNLEQAIEKNKPFVSWINKQYKDGAEVASLCIGAFLLASTGLLNGKSCSTHWLFANQFRSMFPEVELMPDKIITEKNGVYSSGGASSYWNLLLHLVEKHAGRDMAILASKFFLLDIARQSQSPFAIFKGQREHEDKQILQVQEFIESHYQDKLAVETLSDQFGIGRRTFERRFKKATHNTITEYIQRVKMEAAKKQLESGRKTVNEIMYEVGYQDTKAFREVFRRVTGMSPVDYKNKYLKN